MALGQLPQIRAEAPGGLAPRPRVSLISEFQLLIGNAQVAGPHGVQRLVAFLAMAARPVS